VLFHVYYVNQDQITGMTPRVIKGRIWYPKCAKAHICNLTNFFRDYTPDPRYKSERERKGERAVEERGGRGGEVKLSSVQLKSSFI
jgi:hypothetical protein